MKTFQIQDTEGNNWGAWAANDEAEAIKLLMEDVENGPAEYLDEPIEEELVVREVDDDLIEQYSRSTERFKLSTCTGH